MIVKIFISYSHENKEFLKRLQKHLKPLEYDGYVSVWYDGNLKAGDKLIEIERFIDESDIFLCLVSADYLASQACRKELEVARNIENGKKIIAIILKKCVWKKRMGLGDVLALPEEGKPIKKPSNDEAYTYIIEELEKIIEEMRARESDENNKDASISNVEAEEVEKLKEELAEVARQFGIGKNVEKYFFNELEAKRVPVEKWYEVFVDFVNKYKEILEQLESIKVDIGIKQSIDEIGIDQIDKILRKNLNDSVDEYDKHQDTYAQKIMKKYKLLLMRSNFKYLKFEYQEGANILEQAFEVLENELPNSMKTEEIKKMLVNNTILASITYSNEGNLLEGERLAQKGVQFAKQHFLCKDLHLSESFATLSMVYMLKHEPDKSEAVLKEFINLAKGESSERDLNFVRILNELAGVYIAQRKIKEAYEVCNGTRIILEELGDERSDEFFQYLKNLTFFYFAHNNLKEAEKIYENIIQRIKELPENSVDVSNHLSNLAQIYIAQNKFKKAKETLEEELEIYKNNPLTVPKLIRDAEEQLNFVKDKIREQKQ